MLLVGTKLDLWTVHEYSGKAISQDYIDEIVEKIGLNYYVVWPSKVIKFNFVFLFRRLNLRPAFNNNYKFDMLLLQVQ